jgi:hypothetical protein
MSARPANDFPYILRAVIDSRSLPIVLFGSSSSRHLRKLVYNYIATWTNPDGTGAYPGRKKIAHDCGLTVRGLANILKWLKDHHLLRIADERSKLQHEPIHGPFLTRRPSELSRRVGKRRGARKALWQSRQHAAVQEQGGQSEVG